MPSIYQYINCIALHVITGLQARKERNSLTIQLQQS